MPRHPHGLFIPLQAGPGGSGLSLREQIYRACVAAMLDGRLKAGMRLPSARQLAADWRVSRNTVDDALAQLQSEGFVVRRVGAGTFVALDMPGSPTRAGRPRLRPPTALSRTALATASAWSRATSETYTPGSAPRPQAFVAGLPALDAFPFELWRRLVARRLRVSGRSLLGYLPSLGHGPLREATARHLATTRGVACAADQVMILNSTMQAADLIARVLLEHGDAAWVEDPCFPNLHATLAISGARIVPVPVDGHGIVVARGAAAEPAAALAYVTPSFQYPTGVTLSLERRLELLRWADRAGAWVVEDDYQSEFTYEGRPLASLWSLNGGARVLYVGTFTNSVFPSLRLAYVVLPRPLVALFQAVRRQLDDHTHGLAQAVLADFADGGHFHAHLRRMRALYEARRAALVAACARELPPRARLGPTTGGMNAALHLPPRWSDRKVAALAEAAGVRVLPLSRYGAGGSRLNGLLLGYSALTERRIAAGAARLAGVLRDRQVWSKIGKGQQAG
ncbi:MAG: PLP-dependent aminotransferase family protein [Betaproteobacteria bacterium]